MQAKSVINEEHESLNVDEVFFHEEKKILNVDEVCFDKEDESLNVDRVCFYEEHGYEKSRKIKMLLTGVDVVNLGECVQVDWLFCCKNQALENFKLFYARYNYTIQSLKEFNNSAK